MSNECVPAVGKNGQILKRGDRIARKILEQREGPAFEGAICRHLCENDSTAPNGFVCTAHTTWGTRAENVFDLPSEVRLKSQIARSTSPNQAQKALATCPHCGMTSQLRIMKRWHFDNCKFISSTFSPDISNAFD